MRVLIATVTAGGGHIAAAAALEEAWRAMRPDDVVERIDLIRFFSPLHKKLFSDGYVKLVERAPELWGMLFGKTDNLKVARRTQQTAPRLSQQLAQKVHPPFETFPAGRRAVHALRATGNTGVARQILGAAVVTRRPNPFQKGGAHRARPSETGNNPSLSAS